MLVMGSSHQNYLLCCSEGSIPTDSLVTWAMVVLLLLVTGCCCWSRVEDDLLLGWEAMVGATLSLLRLLLEYRSRGSQKGNMF